MEAHEIREAVRERYARTVRDSEEKAARGGCCGSASQTGREPEYGAGACGAGSGCCGGGVDTEAVARAIGYGTEELTSAPEGSNLGLGCGNPVAIASLREGETVLDLGSGAGFDCFLAARKVGNGGRVIGVDMTPEMLERARKNAAKGGYANVEFRLGEIEHLPVSDSSVDAVISNCVLNLSPEKPQVFREAFRVLTPGGRLAVSDVVASGPLSPEMRENLDLYAACVSGAAAVSELEEQLREAGFMQIRIEPVSEPAAPESWEQEPEARVFSANITAVRP